MRAADELQGLGRLQLRQKIREMLEHGGPVLLVLDDVWSDHQVAELLGRGARLPQGSQLLLTSRRRDVLASYNPMPMELLPDASARALLAWQALGQTSLPADLADIAEDAVQRCGGLPLAIKALGGALRKEPATRKAWKVTDQHLSTLCRGLTASMPCRSLLQAIRLTTL